MQEKKKHLAFLIDEYGGVSGIVTTEDIVEEIMGAIDDEYDDAEPKMDKLDDGSYVIDGNYYLDDLNDELSINLQSDDYETIGGFLMNEIGEIPDEDSSEQQVVKIEKLKFTIESWKDRRIDRVVLEINNDEEQTSEEESA
jgi:putative hemolysin